MLTAEDDAGCSPMAHDGGWKDGTRKRSANAGQVGYSGVSSDCTIEPVRNECPSHHPPFKNRRLDDFKLSRLPVVKKLASPSLTRTN